jgi:hypothetical protein
MGRSEARLQFGAFSTGLKGHSAHAKLMYVVVLAEPTVNHCGVGAIRLGRWAREASLTVAEAEAALKELGSGDLPQIVLDEETEEVFVRTLIRNDRVAEQPYVLKGALREALRVESPEIRRYLAAELRKLPEKSPDKISTNGRQVTYPDPHATAAQIDPGPPPEPSPEPSRKGLETLSEDSPEGSETLSGEKGLERVHGGGGGGGSSYVRRSSLSSRTEARDAETKPKLDEPPREDVEAVCVRLRDWMIRNGCKPPTISAEWRRQARLLLDRDERELSKALNLIDWCQQDSFWSGNIHSIPKFREQYDKLAMRAREEWRRNGGRPAPALQTLEGLRERGDALGASRLIGRPYVEPPQPMSDTSDPYLWSRLRAREWIDEHEAEIRTALRRGTA